MVRETRTRATRAFSMCFVRHEPGLPGHLACVSWDTNQGCEPRHESSTTTFLIINYHLSLPNHQIVKLPNYLRFFIKLLQRQVKPLQVLRTHMHTSS